MFFIVSILKTQEIVDSNLFNYKYRGYRLNIQVKFRTKIIENRVYIIKIKLNIISCVHIEGFELFAIGVINESFRVDRFLALI